MIIHVIHSHPIGLAFIEQPGDFTQIKKAALGKIKVSAASFIARLSSTGL